MPEMNESADGEKGKTGGGPPTGLLLCEEDLEACRLCPVGEGVAVVFTGKDPQKDGANQDAAAVLPFAEEAGILVIADGVGGHPGGGSASAVAVRSLEEALREAAAEGRALRGAIINGMERAHQALIDRGSGAASTLAVVEVQGRTVRPYHVGDSQILVFGQRGKVKLLTKSHSPVGFAVEAGVLDEAAAMHHEDRHVISNALGAPDMYIEIGSAVEMAARDTLVVASDGLFDNLRVEEIIEICRKGRPAAAGELLLEACRARMFTPAEGEPSKPDDLSFILYRRRARGT